jgi:hypothetical protein
MNKRVMLSIGIWLTVIGVSAFAGIINVSGRAGLYSAPGASGTSLMYGLSADYPITENLSVRGAIETTSYTVGGVSKTFTPVTADLIYHQTIGGLFHPYLGAGLSYNTITAGGASTVTSGAQSEAGVTFELGGFVAGVELRYFWPDLANTGVNSSSYNTYATGTFSQSLAF